MGRPKKKVQEGTDALRTVAEELGVSLTRVVQIEREIYEKLRWHLGEPVPPKPKRKR